jgi:hypothetical protein
MRETMGMGKTLVPMMYVYSGATKTAWITGYGIAVGKDGKFYMGGTNIFYQAGICGGAGYTYGNIGVATTTGALAVHRTMSCDYIGSGGLTLGPDGNVWFTEQKHIGKITTAGTITEYQYPSSAASNSYGDVTTGPDGNVWFTEYNNNIVGKIVPATGKIIEYKLASSSLSCNPSSIVAGKDGNLYFVCASNELGQITTGGAAKEFYEPYGLSYLPQALVIGGDKNVWFPDGYQAYIGEFNSTMNAFTNYVPPYTSGTVYQMVHGPDNNFWAQETDLKTDVYIVDTLSLSPSSVTFTAVGQKTNVTVSEPNAPGFTATSVSPGVCSVATTAQPNVFLVTANGLGTTTITFKDKPSGFNFRNFTCKTT